MTLPGKYVGGRLIVLVLRIRKMFKWCRRWNTPLLVVIIIILSIAITYQVYELEHIKSQMSEVAIGIQHKNYSNFTALVLRGNGQSVCSKRNCLIRGWRKEFQYGDINLHNETEVYIETSGLYYVSVQMLFYENEAVKRKHDVVDLGISNKQLNKRYVSTSIPLISGMNASTSFISTLLHLRKGFVLGINSVTSGICFNMVSEKTLFNVVLLHTDNV